MIKERRFYKNLKIGNKKKKKERKERTIHNFGNINISKTSNEYWNYKSKYQTYMKRHYAEITNHIYMFFLKLQNCFSLRKHCRIGEKFPKIKRGLVLHDLGRKCEICYL